MDKQIITDFRDHLYGKIVKIAEGKGFSGDIRQCENLFTERVIDSLDFLNLLVEAEDFLGKEVDLSDVNPQEFITFDGLASCFVSGVIDR